MLFLTIIATLVWSTTAQASNIENSMIESESQEFEQYIEQNVVTYDEYEVIQDLRYKDDNELVELGYSKETIDQIKSDELEQTLRKEIMERAEMSVQELKNLGYSDEKIHVLKSLTGEESLEELSARGVFATLSCSAEFLNHYYKTASNTTFMLAKFSWEWSEGTLVALTDGAAVGWNHDFAMNNNLSSLYNKHKITYINTQDSSDVYTVTNIMEEVELNCSIDKFGVAQYQGKTQYFAKKGSGIIALSQTGKVENVKFVFKYGHNTVLADISLSAPFGVGFGLSGVEETYTSGVKNHASPDIM